MMLADRDHIFTIIDAAMKRGDGDDTKALVAENHDYRGEWA